MNIDRDDGDERQVRVDRMIKEFREAQLRRAAKANQTGVQPTADTDTKAPLNNSATSK